MKAANVSFSQLTATQGVQSKTLVQKLGFRQFFLGVPESQKLSNLALWSCITAAFIHLEQLTEMDSNYEILMLHKSYFVQFNSKKEISNSKFFQQYNRLLDFNAEGSLKHQNSDSDSRVGIESSISLEVYGSHRDLSNQIEVQRKCSALAVPVQCSTSMHCTTSEVHMLQLHFLQCRQGVDTVYYDKYAASEAKCTSRESAMRLRVKCIVLQEKRIIEVHRSVHFGALEIRCTSIWVF